MNKTQAITILTTSKAELSDKFGVKKIGLFGSIVRDELRPTSDIDVIVEIERDKKKLHNFLSLRRYLEEKLERSVDLGIESTIKPAVRDIILKETVYV